MFVLKQVQYKEILNIEYLNLQRGKITCIIGPSGSGKTTLLRLLNNLISYDSGSIFFKNQSIDKIDPVELRRQVVMLGQNPVIFEGTVKDNLLIGLKFSEKPVADDEKLRSILCQIHLNKDLDDPSRDLSGGEKQRLALGRVLLMEHEVFLLDEPSSALDEETEQLVIKEMVQSVQQNQKTLIMVTHARKIAEAYGDKIVEIRNGQAFVVKEG